MVLTSRSTRTSATDPLTALSPGAIPAAYSSSRGHRCIKCNGSDLNRTRNANHVWIVTRHKRTAVTRKYHIRLLFAIAVPASPACGIMTMMAVMVMVVVVAVGVVMALMTTTLTPPAAESIAAAALVLELELGRGVMLAYAEEMARSGAS
jgi:hypothetical protein